MEKEEGEEEWGVTLSSSAPIRTHLSVLIACTCLCIVAVVAIPIVHHARVACQW
jgi:hypothetical protein